MKPNIPPPHPAVKNATLKLQKSSFKAKKPKLRLTAKALCAVNRNRHREITQVFQSNDTVSGNVRRTGKSTLIRHYFLKYLEVIFAQPKPNWVKVPKFFRKLFK